MRRSRSNPKGEMGAPAAHSSASSGLTAALRYWERETRSCNSIAILCAASLIFQQRSSLQFRSRKVHSTNQRSTSVTNLQISQRPLCCSAALTKKKHRTACIRPARSWSPASQSMRNPEANPTLVAELQHSSEPKSQKRLSIANPTKDSKSR